MRSVHMAEPDRAAESARFESSELVQGIAWGLAGIGFAIYAFTDDVWIFNVTVAVFVTLMVVRLLLNPRSQSPVPRPAVQPHRQA